MGRNQLYTVHSEAGRDLAEEPGMRGRPRAHPRAGCFSSLSHTEDTPFPLRLSGVQVTSTGKPGHGSRFIEDTAAEKLVCGIRGGSLGVPEAVLGPLSHLTSLS